jgi:hypothetical protein
LILLIVVIPGDARRSASPGTTAETMASEAQWRMIVVAIASLALLVFWMVMAWRAVRALESIAGSLRRRPDPPPAAPPP